MMNEASTTAGHTPLRPSFFALALKMAAEEDPSPPTGSIEGDQQPSGRR